MTKDEALRLALEALNRIDAIERGMVTTKRHHYAASEETTQAITAIREALAEQPAQQQEPVAMYEDWYDSNSCGHCGMVGGHARTCRHYKPTSPSQRKPWVGLTDEEFQFIYDKAIRRPE